MTPFNPQIKNVGKAIENNEFRTTFFVTLNRGDLVKVIYDKENNKYSHIAHSSSAPCSTCNSNEYCFCIDDFSEQIFNQLVKNNSYLAAILQR